MHEAYPDSPNSPGTAKEVQPGGRCSSCPESGCSLCDMGHPVMRGMTITSSTTKTPKDTGSVERLDSVRHRREKNMGPTMGPITVEDPPPVDTSDYIPSADARIQRMTMLLYGPDKKRVRAFFEAYAPEQLECDVCRKPCDNHENWCHYAELAGRTGGE